MKKATAIIVSMCMAICMISVPLNIAAAESTDIKTITVLPYERQKITGWGCFPANYYGGTVNRSKTSNTDTSVITRKAAMSMLFNDIGVTILRGEIVSECGNGDASLNTDWMDKTVAAIKMGQDAGIKDYMITSWTPPYEMMLGEYGAYRFNPDYEDLYCQFIVNAFDYLTSHGCTAPVAYSFQNEPQTGRNWCRITLGQYQRIAKKMRKALDEGGYKDVRLLAPECASYYQHSVILGTNFSSLYDDPEFTDAIGIFGTHSYCAISTGASKDTDVYQFAMNCSNFPEKERWETEFSGGTGTIPEYAALRDISMNLTNSIFTTEIMLGDIMFGGINCWMYWNGYEHRQFTYPDKTTRFMETGALGGSQAFLYGNGFSEVKKNNIGVALGTIWKNVPVGSVVHWCWTDDETMFNTMGLRSDFGAFIREDGTTVLVVVNKNNVKKEYNINGLSGVSAKIHTINADTDQEAKVSYRNVIGGSIKNFICEPCSINVIVTENKDFSESKITIIPDETSSYADGVYTVPKDEIVIKGCVDEKVDYLTANGKEVKVKDDLSFSFEINAKEENSIVLECKDSSSGKITKETFDVVYTEGFINLNIEKLPESVNTAEYTFKIHTGIDADIYINGKKMNEKKSSSFEIPMELNQGVNKLEISAVSGSSRKEKTVEIFCDSVKPKITFNESEKVTNDWEYLISGNINEPLSSLVIGGDDVFVNDDLTFSAKTNLSEGENEIKVKAVDLYGNMTDETIFVTHIRDDNTPHYVNGKMYVRKTDETIDIDGKLKESSWKTDIKICKQVTGNYPSNNICNIGLLWDEKYIYIGAKVKDTQFHCDTQNAYNNDSIEFLFNPSASRAGAFEPADKQLFSGPINGDKSTYYQNKKAPNIVQKYNVHEGGYEAEIAVPWTEVEKIPELGAVLGFEIVCNDDDTPDNSRTSIMTWSTENTDYYSFTSDYGLIELVGENDFRYEDITFEAEKSKEGGAETIEENGVIYKELESVCNNYGAAYYDNPNTNLVNVFTSHSRKVDITEGAYQTFVDNELVKWKNPVIKKDNFYYIDEECEKALFKGITPFQRYFK